MEDKSRVIFGNQIPEKVVRSAEKAKAGYLKKFGDDSSADYRLATAPIDALDFLGVKNFVFGDATEPLAEKPLVVGNIRMGFGHYRISIAMASCAHALGYTPYWLDLASFDATGSKMIRAQNDLYSLASRISQKSKLFNHFIWEPLNSEGFRKITYNAKDQKNSELLVPIFASLPKDVPYIATHVWPAQGAIHAGLTHVVNAIPDNWPMGLHLSEGAIHTVQTPFAYYGYKTLRGFDKKPLSGIPEKELKMVGRYVDHELLVHLAEDNEKRRERALSGAPMRFLMTVGGAGAGYKQFLSMVRHLLPYIKEEKATLFLNFGDHRDAFERLQKDLELPELKTYFNDYKGLKELVSSLRGRDHSGLVAIYNKDIFEAVYSTNLLMPECDILITKPSELAYYPIPKLFMRHIGGHEVYGAVCSAEAGDGSPECDTEEKANEAIDRFLADKELFCHLCDRIDELHKSGAYNGGYECVKLAAGDAE